MPLSSYWALLLLLASGSRAMDLLTDRLLSAKQIFFSVIPPTRPGIGTDSRIGVGFRFGPFADAQVVWELGPQNKTRPLARPQPEEYSKRQVPQVTRTWDPWLHDVAVPDLVDNSLRQRSLRVHPGRHADLATRPPQPPGGDWLNRWRAGLSQRSPRGSQDDSRSARTDLVAVRASPPSAAQHKDAESPSPESSLTTTETPVSPTPRSWLGMLDNTSGRLKSHGKTSREETTASTVDVASREPEVHLRMAMASLAARSSTPVPDRNRILANPIYPLDSPRNTLFRVLRQLWEAGARSVRG